MTKDIAKVWEYKSTSSAKIYQTLLYSDGTTSCDCPGWTRRVNKANGTRTCRHTRSVDMGRADAEATSFHAYGTSPQKKQALAVNAKKTSRHFDFSEE